MAEPATEDAGAKKSPYAYNYFSQTIAAAPAAAPRKLTDEEVAAQQKEIEARNLNAGASAWNHAGTFEERSWTEWAKERLGLLIKDQCASGKGGHKLSVTSVTVDKGHANAWIVRGKKRHGFDFELTISWTVNVGGTDIAGSAKVPNAASDELDDLSICDCTATDNNTAGASAAVRAVEQLLPDLLVGRLQVLLEELKQK